MFFKTMIKAFNGENKKNIVRHETFILASLKLWRLQHVYITGSLQVEYGNVYKVFKGKLKMAD